MNSHWPGWLGGRTAAAGAVALGLLSASATAVSAQTVKLASLAPDGSVWDLILEEQTAAWKRDTGGRLDVRLYPGGVAGDDPALVLKMRIGQFQAAALTFQGLMAIDEGFRVFALPLFYESDAELYHVVARLEPVLRKRLEERGFVLLNWGYAGWARLYSRRPIRSTADLRAHKLFLWGGDERTTRLYRAHGLDPVGVAGTDVTMALQTGMIDCLGTPPLVALTLQWFRQVNHQLDAPLAPLVGATIMTRKAWEALSAADQAAILSASRRAEERHVEEVPVQERRAMAAMQERGLVVTSILPEAEAEWHRLGDLMATAHRGALVPEEIYDLALRARDEYRAGGRAHP